MVLINRLFQPIMTGTRHIFWSFYKNNYEIKLINRNLYASAELLSDLKIRIIHVTFKTLSVFFPRNTIENPFLSQSHDRHVDSIVHAASRRVTFHETPFRKIEHRIPELSSACPFGCPLRRREPREPVHRATPNDLLCGEWDLRAFSQWQWVLFRCGLEVSRHLENGATTEWLAQKGFFPEPIAPAVLFVEGNFVHAKINRKFSRSAEWKNSCERIKM